MYTDRYKAQAVVRELVTKFTEQNVTVQRNQASLTTNFLKDEVKSAKDKLERIEEEIVKFKRANMGKLPEQAQANAQALQTYNLQLMSTAQTLNRLLNEKTLLEQDIVGLRNRENSLSNGLTETIPGTTSEAITAQNPRIAQMSQVIANERSKLALLKESKGSGHPDVADLDLAIQQMERERDEAEKREAATTVVKAGSSSGPQVVTNWRWRGSSTW